MIDRSRLTSSERDVLKAALEQYDEKCSKLATKTHSPNVASDCKWRSYVAADLCEQIAGR